MVESQREKVRAREHLRAIVSLPGVVILIVPAVTLWRSESVRLGGSLQVPWSLLLALPGCALIAVGLLLMVRTISAFHGIGNGTLAPWNPPRQFVVIGAYRHVRNPMIGGVLLALLGESALFGSTRLLLWFALFAVVNLVYIPLSEEPGLERRFGADYALYRMNVPRWIPRLRPWTGPSDRGSRAEREGAATR